MEDKVIDTGVAQNSTPTQVENGVTAKINNPTPEEVKVRLDKYLNDVCQDAGITRGDFLLLDEIQRAATREYERTGILGWLYTADNLADCVNVNRSENHLFKPASDIPLITAKQIRSLLDKIFGSAETQLLFSIEHINIEQVTVQEPVLSGDGRVARVPRYKFPPGYEMRSRRGRFLENLHSAEDGSVTHSFSQNELIERCNCTACLQQRTNARSCLDRIHVELSIEARRHAAVYQDGSPRQSRLVRYYATSDKEAVIPISREDRDLLNDIGNAAMNVWVRQRGEYPYIHFTPAQIAYLVNDYRLNRFNEGITNSLVLATTQDLAELLETVFQPGLENKGYASLRCIAGAFLSGGYLEETDTYGNTVRIPIYGQITRDYEETENDFGLFMDCVEMKEVENPSELSGKRISFRGQEFRLQPVDGNPQTSSNAALPPSTEAETKASDVLQQHAEESSRKVTMPSDSHGGGGAV